MINFLFSLYVAYSTADFPSSHTRLCQLADFPSLNLRSTFAHRSSHTRLRQLADFPSLNLRSTFAQPSLNLR